MSTPDQINAALVAQRILANPRTFRVSTNEDLAMAGCIVGLCAELDAAEEALASRPATCASLAAAIAGFIRAEEDLEASRLPDGFLPHAKWAARLEAFNTLKTIFETEFPK